jgi:hypothetical protein
MKTEGVIEFFDGENPYFPYCTKGDKLPIENCKNQENAGKSYIFCMISFIYIYILIFLLLEHPLKVRIKYLKFRLV